MGIKLLVFCLSLCLPIAASATDWYIFDVGQMSCINARSAAQEKNLPELASPYAFRQAVRGLSSYGGTRVYHYPDGQMGVVIKEMHREMFFFSSLQVCQTYKLIYESTGHHVSNLNELK